MNNLVRAGADPEKWKERWLKWCTKGAVGNFWLINYSLGYVSCLCQSTCSCSCQCSTTIVKRMKQATLFGFLVLNMLSLPCLSNGFVSHHLLCLQESCCGDLLSQKWLLWSESALLWTLLWTLHTQGGVASHPIHPLDQPLKSLSPCSLMEGSGSESITMVWNTS